MNCFKGLALSFSTLAQSMGVHAREAQECELLIIKHRGQERLDLLKEKAMVTVHSYSDLIENEANEIRRELILRSL